MSLYAWFIVGACSLVIYCILEAVYRYRYTSRGKKKLPCQTPLPIIGNALHFLKDRTTEGLYRAFDLYLPESSLSGLWIGPKYMVMINDAGIAENLLPKGISSKKPEEMYRAFDYVAEGLFATRDLKRWSALRKPLDKMMSPKAVEVWKEVFDKNANEYCKSIAAAPTTFDLEDLSFFYSMLNIAETHMGVTNFDEVRKFLGSLHRDVNEIADLIMLRVWDVTSDVRFLCELTQNFRRLRSALKRSLSILHDVFEWRTAYLNQINLGRDESRCFADVIMEYSEKQNLDGWTRAKLASDFVVAAAHTTTNTLASCILFLAMHPEYQEKLYEELCDVMGDYDRIPTEEEMNKMVYLDMVVKETLRHSGAPGVARKLEKDVEIDDYVVPSGSILWFNFLKLTRNPNYWERPKEFYPDHFSAEAEAKRPKGAFNPFSQGVRACAGRLYALVELKMGIIKIIRRFWFTTHLHFEDIKFVLNLVRIPDSFACVAHPRKPTLNS